MKKRVLLVLALSLALVGLTCSGAFAAKKIVVKVASYYGPTHPGSRSVEYFKENLEKDTNGAFDVQYFPNSQLGGEEAIIDHVKRGTIQVGISGSLIKKDEPRMGAMEAPFAIETWKQAKTVYDGEGGRMLAGDYTKTTGVHIMGYFVNGFRVISSRFPLENMADLGKMKIRVPTTDVYVKTFQGLGCNTVMMPISEVYNALETKVVDGQDNPYPTLKASGWWEVQSAVLESRHMFSTNPFLVNGKFLDSLSPEHRAAFEKWVKAAVDYNWQVSQEDDEESAKFVESKGLKIIRPSQEFRQQMKDSLKGFNEWFYAEVPGAKEFVEYCASVPKD